MLESILATLALFAVNFLAVVIGLAVLLSARRAYRRTRSRPMLLLSLALALLVLGSLVGVVSSLGAGLDRSTATIIQSGLSAVAVIFLGASVFTRVEGVDTVDRRS